MSPFIGYRGNGSLSLNSWQKMNRRAYLLENLHRYPTMSELRRSAFFAECGQELHSLLTNPEILRNAQTTPRVQTFLRIVQWNIEKGKRLEAIAKVLRTDETLRWADIILLNEVDIGMCRSGNRHIGRALAEALGMNMAFGPAHFELTKGTHDELDLPGENSDSLQGNAILTRHPILEARVVPLPVCFEPYEFHEKRYGWRSCIWARLQVASRTLWAGCTHLEVRNTPQCRARQMRHLIACLPGETDEPHLLAGDLNTSGFSRGTRWRTIRSIGRLLLRPPERMKDAMSHPERRGEPLFRVAQEAGFSWDGLNSGEPTAWSPIGSLEDASHLPSAVVHLVSKRLAAYEGYLRLKLDWFLARGLEGLRKGEAIDRDSGVPSLDPGCVSVAATGPGRISDHAPIHADARLCSSGWGAVGSLKNADL